MKKNYVKPTREVYVLNQHTKLLVGSDHDWNLNYIPTIPGQPEDEKQLA